MDIIDALVKRLIEDEDLLKAVSPRQIQRLLDHIKDAQNTKLSPQQRHQALQHAISIAHTGEEKKAPKAGKKPAAAPKPVDDYNPLYAHYNISKDMWKALPTQNRNDVHAFHKQVIGGELDNDPAHKDIVAKVKASQAPKLP